MNLFSEFYVVGKHKKKTKLEGFYKILPNMCSFPFFSEFIKACDREPSNSNFFICYDFSFLHRNSPQQLIYTHKTEFRLKGLNAIFTVRFSEGKKK